MVPAGFAFQHRYGPALVTLLIAVVLVPGNLAGRCSDPGGLGSATMSQVLSSSKKNCPFNETRKVRDGIVLAYRGWRQQQLITEIVAYAMEEILNTDVEFRDLRSWPTNFEYQKNCSYIPPRDCEAVFEVYGKNYSGCMRLDALMRWNSTWPILNGWNGPHAMEVDSTYDRICSTAKTLDVYVNPEDLRYCYKSCKDPVNTCYDVDMEVSAYRRSPPAEVDFNVAVDRWTGWGKDLGPAEFTISHGLYFWPPSLQPMTWDGTVKRGASAVSQVPTNPYFDWYFPYTGGSNDSYQMRRIFEPIPGLNESAAADGPCNDEWNALNPLVNMPWCTNGSYIPPQCRDCEDCCGELYHFSPAFSMGEAEAIISSNNWPYRVTYLSETVYKSLSSQNKPFLFFTTNQFFDQDYFTDAVRIQFPLHNANSMCTVSFLSSPEDPKYCELADHEPYVVISRTMREFYPAAMMLVQAVKDLITQDVLNRFLSRDEFLTRDGNEPRIRNSAACSFVLENMDTIKEGLVYCDDPRQYIHEANRSCTCLPGTYIDYVVAKCLVCPVNHYCPGDVSQPIQCGNHSVSPLRSRELKDCECIPGYGLEGEIERGCFPCSGGFYKNNTANTQCKGRCQPHSWSFPASKHSLDCWCWRGYYLKRYDPSADIPGTCVKCEELKGGADGAICHGDNNRLFPDSMFPAGIPKYQGYDVGIPHRLPYAEVGWFLIYRGDVNSKAGYELEFEQCFIVGACLGLNRCREGHEGLLCGQCKKGYARGTMIGTCNQCFYPGNFAFLVVVGVFWFVIIILLAGVMTRHAVQHVNNGSAFFKIAVHMIVVTSPIMSLEPVWYGIRWFCFAAYLPTHAWWSLACMADLFHSKQYYHLTVTTLLLFTVWPVLSLIGCAMIVRAFRMKYFEHYKQSQHHVRELEEIIHLCDSMTDLRMTDIYVGTRRMDNVRHELERHLETIVYESRICHIWRTVYRKKEIPNFTQDVVMFLADSTNIILIHYTVLYHYAIPKVLASFMPRTFGLGLGTRLMADPDIEFFNLGHCFVLPAGILLFTVFGIGFPVFTYCVISMNRMDLAKEHVGKKIGWLYHGFKARAPYCYAQVMLMVERFFVVFVLEGYMSRRVNCLLYMVGAVTAVVFHSRFAPFEDINYRILDKLEGGALLAWCVTAAVYNQTMSQRLETELVKQYDKPMVRIAVMCLPVIYIAYWLAWWIALYRTMRSTMFNDEHIREVVNKADEPKTAVEKLTRAVLLQEKNYRTNFVRMGLRARTMPDPKAKSCSEHELMLKELVLLPGYFAYKKEFSLDEGIEEIHSSHKLAPQRRPLSLAHLMGGGLKRQTSPSLTELKNKLVEYREFQCPEYELMAVADVLIRALETLMTIHGIRSLPFCALEFVVADSFHHHFWGKSQVAIQRQKIYDYINSCHGGKEQGLTDIFDGGDAVPKVTNQIRVHHLKEAAHGGAAYNWKHRMISVRMLEEYVVYLQCEDSSIVRTCVDQFDIEVQKFRKQLPDDRRISTKELRNHSTQTYLYAERSTQTEHTCLHTTGTHVPVHEDTEEAGMPGLWFRTMKNLQKEHVSMEYESGLLSTKRYEAQEKEVVALREAEMMREELLKACQEQMTLVEEPAPRPLTNGTANGATNGQDHKEEHKENFFERMGHAIAHGLHRGKAEEGSQASCGVLAGGIFHREEIRRPIVRRQAFVEEDGVVMQRVANGSHQAPVVLRSDDFDQKLPSINAGRSALHSQLSLQVLQQGSLRSLNLVVPNGPSLKLSQLSCGELKTWRAHACETQPCVPGSEPHLLGLFPHYKATVSIGPLILGAKLRRVAIIGAGGGAMVHALHRFLPDLVIDAIEYSHAVADVTQACFSFPKSVLVQMHIDDGMSFMDLQPDAHYDWIIVDAAGSMDRYSSQNAHRLFARVLSKQGLLTYNFAGFDKLAKDRERGLAVAKRVWKYGGASVRSSPDFQDVWTFSNTNLDMFNPQIGDDVATISDDAKGRADNTFGDVSVRDEHMATIEQWFGKGFNMLWS